MRLEGVVWWHVNSSFYNCAASQVNSSVNPHKCGLSEPVGGFLDSAHINKKNPLDASYTFYNRKMNYKCSNFTIAVFVYLCICVFVSYQQACLHHRHLCPSGLLSPSCVSPLCQFPPPLSQLWENLHRKWFSKFSLKLHSWVCVLQWNNDTVSFSGIKGAF